MAPIPLFMIPAVIGLVVGLYIMIKKRLYSQALMLLGSLVGIACGIAGILKLVDDLSENDIVGAILTGIGVLTVLAVGVLIKITSPKDVTANN